MTTDTEEIGGWTSAERMARTYLRRKLENADMEDALARIAKEPSLENAHLIATIALQPKRLVGEDLVIAA